MLNSNRKGIFAIAAALSVFASSAPAADIEVSIVDGSFFPSVIFANTGDDILIYNESESTQTVVGPEESWTSGAIAIEATYRLTLEEETPLSFSSSDGEATAEIVLGN